MVRLASQQSGGYFPTPPHLIPALAALIDSAPSSRPLREDYGRPQYGTVALLDPCAGTGAALLDLAQAWFGPDRATGRPELVAYACELEATRAATLQAAWTAWGRGGSRAATALHGDAFRAGWTLHTDWSQQVGISLLYLNPPYDQDRRYGRLEEAFLTRFTPTLIPGRGVLLWVVPAATLAASAVTLATHYEHVSCYRFPVADAGFGQVVLVARRAAHPLPFGAEDSPLAGQLRAWAAAPATLPALPPVGTQPPDLALAADFQAGFARWAIQPLDLTTIRAAVRPGQHAAGTGEPQPLRSLGLDGGLADLVVRPHPVAVPLRPGYVALAIAEGIFNGRTLHPDQPSPGRPPLLLKAVFARGFQTTDTRTDAQGRVTALVQVQQPQLAVTALDLTTLTYHTLISSSQASEATTLAQMTVGDLIEQYSGALRAALAVQCPVLHDPGDPRQAILLPPLARPLFAAQAQAVMALLKLLWQGQGAYLLGQIGVGKSTTALGVLAALGAGSPGRRGIARAGCRPHPGLYPVLCTPRRKTHASRHRPARGRPHFWSALSQKCRPPRSDRGPSGGPPPALRRVRGNGIARLAAR